MLFLDPWREDAKRNKSCGYLSDDDASDDVNVQMITCDGIV